MPSGIREWLDTATIDQNQIGLSSASVYRCSNIGGSQRSAFLKLDTMGALQREVEVIQWLQGKLPVPVVYAYESSDTTDYLLMSELKGTHGASSVWIEKPELLVRAYAEGLKKIHAVDCSDCPWDAGLAFKMKQARAVVTDGKLNMDLLEDQYKPYTAEQLWALLEQRIPADEDLVFTHGDYCLPNIILASDCTCSGFIDWGRAGIADRYQDIALAVRSLKHNGLGNYTDMFLQSYGVTDANLEKIEFYILLDEFF